MGGTTVREGETWCGRDRSVSVGEQSVIKRLLMDLLMNETSRNPSECVCVCALSICLTPLQFYMVSAWMNTQEYILQRHYSFLHFCLTLTVKIQLTHSTPHYSGTWFLEKSWVTPFSHLFGFILLFVFFMGEVMECCGKQYCFRGLCQFPVPSNSDWRIMLLVKHLSHFSLGTNFHFWLHLLTR